MEGCYKNISMYMLPNCKWVVACIIESNTCGESICFVLGPNGNYFNVVNVLIDTNA